jgi:hypothetical protein
MRSFRLGSLIFSLIVIGAGVALLIDKDLPVVIRRYWPLTLMVWGAASIVNQLRSREDSWAGTDYGTGLYVIRHRRRRRGWLLPGIGLILVGGFLLWATLDPASGITFGPLVLIGLGVIALLGSLTPPPSKDF